MKLQNIIIFILTLGLSISYVNAIDYEEYGLEYGNLCREQLSEQVFNSSNKLDYSLQKRIDGLMPNLDKKYSDEKILFINQKIFTLISKVKKDSKSYNTYIYLLRALDKLIDDELFTKEYNKKECSLLLEPLKFDKELENIDSLEGYIGELGISKQEAEYMISSTYEKYQNEQENYDEYEQGIHDASLKRYIEYDYINTISKEEYQSNLMQEYEEVSPPYGLTKDIKYDLGLTLDEQNELNNLNESIKLKFSEKLKAQMEMRINYFESKEKIKEIDEEIKLLSYKKLYLIKLKWERKNICISKFKFTLVKDRDTFHSISLRNGKELMDLEDDFFFARYYGYNLSCRFLKLYPEFKTKSSELMKKSSSELSNLATKSLSFIPKSNNYDYEKYPSFSSYEEWIVDDENPYGRPFTGYEQALEDYDVALQMQKHIFLPIKEIVSGKTSDKDIFGNIPLFENEFYKIRQ